MGPIWSERRSSWLPPTWSFRTTYDEERKWPFQYWVQASWYLWRLPIPCQLRGKYQTDKTTFKHYFSDLSTHRSKLNLNFLYDLCATINTSVSSLLPILITFLPFQWWPASPFYHLLFCTIRTRRRRRQNRQPSTNSHFSVTNKSHSAIIPIVFTLKASVYLASVCFSLI